MPLNCGKDHCHVDLDDWQRGEIFYCAIGCLRIKGTCELTNYANVKLLKDLRAEEDLPPEPSCLQNLPSFGLLFGASLSNK